MSEKDQTPARSESIQQEEVLDSKSLQEDQVEPTTTTTKPELEVDAGKILDEEDEEEPNQTVEETIKSDNKTQEDSDAKGTEAVTHAEHRSHVTFDPNVEIGTTDELKYDDDDDNRAVPNITGSGSITSGCPGDPEGDHLKTLQYRQLAKSLVNLLTSFEKCLFVLGLVSAVLLGLIPPYVIYSFANLIEAFVKHAKHRETQSEMLSSETAMNSTPSLYNKNMSFYEANDTEYYNTVNFLNVSVTVLPESTFERNWTSSTQITDRNITKVPYSILTSSTESTILETSPSLRTTTMINNYNSSSTTSIPQNHTDVISMNSTISVTTVPLTDTLNVTDASNVTAISATYGTSSMTDTSNVTATSGSSSATYGTSSMTTQPISDLNSSITSQMKTSTLPSFISSSTATSSSSINSISEDSHSEDPSIINRIKRDINDSVDNMTLTEDDISPSTTPNDYLIPKTASFGLLMAILAVTTFVVGFSMVLCLSLATEYVMFRLRQLLLQKLLHKDIQWIENQKKEDLEEFMSEGLTKFHNVLGENLGLTLSTATTTVSCILEALIYGWKLTLVLCTVLPIFAIAKTMYSKIDERYINLHKKEYETANTAIKSTLSAIKTVQAYGGEYKEYLRLVESLRGSRWQGERRGWISGFMLALAAFAKHSAFAVAFWYGITLAIYISQTERPAYRTKELYIVLFATFSAFINVFHLIPHLDSIHRVIPIASKTVQWLQESSSIDSSSADGNTLKSFHGSIEFEDIHFNYFSNPSNPILSNMSFTVAAGETVALVGPAKQGKTTILQLLQRFYDPQRGKVLIDNVELRTLQVGWFRSQVAVVEAQPVLFSTTIRENIRYGKQDATIEEIVNAARAANAHRFISALPQQYNTIVGEHGTALSDSEKQRIAIARALVRDPAILLLDGASVDGEIAMDPVVQEALENARSSRTTVIVPHEISVIKHIEKILVVSDGRITESGNHQSLMEAQGVYYKLFNEEMHNKKPQFPDWQDEIDDDFEEDIFRSSSSSSINTTTNTEVSTSQSSTLTTKRKRIYATNDWMDISKFEIWPTFVRLFRSGRDYILFYSLGVFSSVAKALLFVVFTVILGHYHGLLSNTNDEDVVIIAHNYALVIFVIGIFVAFFSFMQNSMFTYYGERLSNHLRKRLFIAILRQDVSWFDDPDNNVESLCSTLATDPTLIRDMAALCAGRLIYVGVMGTAAALVVLIYSWKMAIIAAMFTAVGVFITCLQAKVLDADAVLRNSSLDASAKIATEGLLNIKTVATLHAQNLVCTQYETALHRIKKLSMDIYSIRGLLFGITRCAPLLLYSAVNSLGGYLIMFEVLHHQKVIVIQHLTEAVFFAAAQAVGVVFTSIQALESAHRIFQLVDQRPRIDGSINSGFMLPVRGSRNVAFESLHFSFRPHKGPSRTLCDVSFEIIEKEVTAIVGPSRGGKSLCLQLIERFYDPRVGSVVVDHIDIQNLNVSWLRSQIAMISEKFIMWDRTVFENIAFGNNMVPIKMEDVIQVCRTTGLHGFVLSLPKSYDVVLEDQRPFFTWLRKLQILCARALVRNPKIILFDDPFPPPGSEDLSEIQDLVMKVCEGRTAVITSRYVTSLPPVNHIVVLRRKVLQQGMHEQLMQTKGRYANQWRSETQVLQVIAGVHQ